MSREVTHHGGRQIVSRDTLRRVLREDGESCFCAPLPDIEWDAGECPQHADCECGERSKSNTQTEE